MGSNRVAMLQRRIPSIMAMPQCKVVHPSRQLLRKTMPSIRQRIDQSQHNPYESESPGSMNVNEVAMPQCKPPEVTML